MPVTLSIKNAPDEVVARLKARAARHHRSLQGELMAIVEQAALEDEPRLNAAELLREARALNLPPAREATAMIREDRDRDEGR
jgi:plasmid stability protein